MNVRLRNFLWKVVNRLPVSCRLSIRNALMRCRIFEYEPEWHRLAALGPNHGTALDIGANRGYYAIALAGLYDRVIAFEPNPAVRAELEACRHPRIDVRSEALSDRESMAKLFVPRSSRGEILDGWASFDRENLPGRAGEEEIEVRALPLDALGFEGVTFVKMDVEGHEVSVLRGAEQFLRRNRPTMLVEVRPSTAAEVESLLTAAGLREEPLLDKAPGDQVEAMRLFVPA